MWYTRFIIWQYKYRDDIMGLKRFVCATDYNKSSEDIVAVITTSAAITNIVDIEFDGNDHWFFSFSRQVTIFNSSFGCLPFAFVGILFFFEFPSVEILVQLCLQAVKKRTLFHQLCTGANRSAADDQTKRKHFGWNICVCVRVFLWQIQSMRLPMRCMLAREEDSSESCNPISIVLNNNFLCIDNMIRYDWRDRYRKYTCFEYVFIAFVH